MVVYIHGMYTYTIGIHTLGVYAKGIHAIGIHAIGIHKNCYKLKFGQIMTEKVGELSWFLEAPLVRQADGKLKKQATSVCLTTFLDLNLIKSVQS